jgi:RNA polymerase-binding protein DksA
VPKKAAPAAKAVATKAAPAKAPAKQAAAKAAPRPAPAQTPAEAAAATAAATKPSTGRKKATARAPETVVRTPQSNVPAARKAPGPTTSSAEPRALVVRADEDPWTKAELTEVRNELRAEVSRLRDELDMAEHEIDDMLRDSGDGAGDDAADAGSKTFEREHEMSLANNTRDMLVQAERALARIDNRTYGVCENCGNPIGKARLQVFPRATLCMTCKQREERR